MMFKSPGGGKDGMHPDDMRNMFIFFILAALIYMAADAYIFKPQAAALRHAQLAQKTQSVQAEAVIAAMRPRAEIIGEGGRVAFHNDHIQGTISLRGARLDDLALKDYFVALDHKENITLLSPKGTAHARNIDYGWVASDKAVKVPDEDTVWAAVGNGDLSPGQPVTLRWDNSAGIVFENTLELDENFLFTITQKFTNKTGEEIALHPYGLVSQTGLPADYKGLWVSHEGPIGYIGDELAEYKYNGFRKEPSHSLSARYGWTGITDKYWLSALIPVQGQETTYRFNRTGPATAKKQPEQGRFQADFTAGAVSAKPGETATFSSHVFTGAKKVSVLKQYGHDLDVKNFDLAVDFGWFWFLSKPFYWGLHYLYKFTGNMGVAIILLTVLIRSAVFPLTNLSYKSFAKMKKITPEIAALRDKYGKDKVALQAELVKLYQRESVNPMAGCLPMIVQIPIFFALYKVLVVTIEMRQAPFFGWIHDLSAADPTNIFTLFGAIDWSPPVFMHIGIWPCFLFAGYWMQKQLNPPPQDAIQRDMNVYFPFLMTFMMAKFASGLVIYWTFSAFFGILQQSIIMHRMGVPIHFLKSREEKKLEKAARKGKSVHPLIEMAEEKAEDALFGDELAAAPAGPMSPPKKRRKKKR